MEDIINGKSKTHYIGNEDIIYNDGTIKCYLAHTKDCYRLVYKRSSGLQIMNWKNHPQLGASTFHVANVYTIPNQRKKGFAKALFKKAKEIIKTNKIYHSSNLSPLGKIYAEKVN